jgi:hypothetical protein
MGFSEVELNHAHGDKLIICNLQCLCMLTPDLHRISEVDLEAITLPTAT